MYPAQAVYGWCSRGRLHPGGEWQTTTQIGTWLRAIRSMEIGILAAQIAGQEGVHQSKAETLLKHPMTIW